MPNVFFCSSTMALRSHFVLAFLALAASGCGSAGGATNITPPNARAAVNQLANARGENPLGPVLTTSDGGQVFEFDIDQHGDDGLLASVSASDTSVQTFDATTGNITKTFAMRGGRDVGKGDD